MYSDISTRTVAYTGRFAPSPTGALHAGSLVAALASWLDARAHGGRWLVRIEDVDSTRCHPQHARTILAQLQQHGLVADAEPVWQSQRGAIYAQALEVLHQHGLVYGCACSRREIALARQAAGYASGGRHVDTVYPGTCHPARGGTQGRPVRAWRLDVCACLQHGSQSETVCWWDRRLGTQWQNVVQDVGDFVLQRADGLWAYQLAVVVDDAQQGITHVVRGVDLADNTPRQMVLQQALGVPTPTYLHTPLVLALNGEKLSKQNAAQPLPEGDVQQSTVNLQAAAQVLGLPAVSATTPQQALAQWVGYWRNQYVA